MRFTRHRALVRRAAQLETGHSLSAVADALGKITGTSGGAPGQLPYIPSEAFAMTRFLSSTPSAEDIQREIRSMVSTFEQLRRGASRDSRAQLDVLRLRAERLLHRSRWDDTYSAVLRKSRDSGHSTGDYVRERPVSTVALGIAGAALLGWLVSRR
ncbi:DUF883 family protein [Pseudomonas borbori]